MKKKLLPLAMLAGLAGATGTAQAVHINADGHGQSLIYPYYTVEGSQETYINVVNTTDEVKAVKVRFLEAMNSREVLDFNLYLSPEDHWSGAITRDDDGGAKLVVHEDETSCTAPIIPEDGQAFFNFEYEDDSDGLDDDGNEVGPDLTNIERTREGYVEIIEMGTVVDAAAGDDEAFNPASAATHSDDGGAPNCNVINAAWLADGVEDTTWDFTGTGEWDEDASVNIEEATGGIYGYGVIVDVENGTNASYSAVALDNFWAEGDSSHTETGSLLPALEEAQANADIIAGNEVIQAEMQDGISAVSAVFMRDQIMNDYVLEPAMQADTDWVVTFPTKRFYVNETDPVDPFLSTWDGSSACEEITLSYWDRDEQVPGVDPITGGLPFSPQPDTDEPEPDFFQLCSEANIITFYPPEFPEDEAEKAAYTGVLTASPRVRYGFQPEFDNGWMRIGFATEPSSGDARELVGLDDTAAPTQEYTFSGLPVTGFAIQRYTNTGLDGVEGNGAFYAGLIDHKSTRDIETVSID